MFKILALTTLLFSSVSFAQECPDLGWTNQGVLHAVLEQKGRELIDVKFLKINSSKQVITYQLEGSFKIKHYKYKTCGEEITFSR